MQDKVKIFEFVGGSEMVGRIVGLVSCLMCAVPFFIISVYNKDSNEPINFWSGDTSLKNKVKNIRDYNKEMAALYKKCAFAFLIAGIGYVVYPIVGIVLICFDCTVGIYIVYSNYKKILKSYSG